jgi:hypothetical protein
MTGSEHENLIANASSQLSAVPELVTAWPRTAVVEPVVMVSEDAL